MSKFKIYLKSILIPVIIGAVVGILISGSIDYDSLKQPFLSPPSIAFPIVWTILYILMGISYGILIILRARYHRAQLFFLYFFTKFLNSFCFNS